MAKQTSKQAFEILARYEKLAAAGNISVTQRMLDGLRHTAENLLTTEMVAKEKNFLSKNTGADWWELAKKQYPITEVGGKFCVTSTAKEWAEIKDWEFSHRYEALAKIEQLVNWLNQNRKRGRGDVDADIEKISAKIEAHSA